VPGAKPVCGGRDLKQPQEVPDYCHQDRPADELQDGRSPLEGGDRRMLDFITLTSFA
jgi:hypothetical protein